MNSLTGVPPPEVGMEPIDEEMSNELVTTRHDSKDPQTEGQSSHGENVHASRVRGASHGIQAPNSDDPKILIQPDGLGYAPPIIYIEMKNEFLD